MAVDAGQRARALGLKKGDAVSIDGARIAGRWERDVAELGPLPKPRLGHGVIWRILDTEEETFDVEVAFADGERYCYALEDLWRTAEAQVGGLLFPVVPR
jgi:hypothetical protein